MTSSVAKKEKRQFQEFSSKQQGMGGPSVSEGSQKMKRGRTGVVRILDFGILKTAAKVGGAVKGDIMKEEGGN